VIETPKAARTALVTGANRGIGFEIARQLAEAGTTVFAGVRYEARLAMARNAFDKTGVDIKLFVLDVADTAHIPTVLDQIEGQHGAIDILINNAAILIDGPGGFDASLFKMTDDVFRRTWETNVAAPTATMRTLIPRMIARGYGRVVNMSSLAGQMSSMRSGFPAYRVSKAALNALTRIAATEAASASVDIKINACSPGWVRTEMGGPGASRSPVQGAETAVWLATLPSSGPSGGFFQDKTPLPW
jgi:NAD(P)-dependent dehydrogenase (short-subunit alcohol dehydrogenase family)